MEASSQKTAPSHPSLKEGKKKTEWKDIPVIIIYIAVLIIGLILMWLLERWSKRAKIIFTGVVLMIYVISVPIGWILVTQIREKFEQLEKKEFEIETKMREIGMAAEIIYDEEGSYRNVNCDHPYLASLCSYLTEKTGARPILYSFLDKYCGYIKLAGGKYFCLEGKEGRSKARYTTFYPGEPGYCDGITFICP